jgi:hypothetical protein
MRIATRKSRSALVFAVAAACLVLAGTASAGPIPATNGKDTIEGTPRADNLNGRGGNDHISGGRGNDTIAGGGGRDALDGGPGSDTINARDRKLDVVTCGGGTDTVRADGKDVVADDCENVNRTTDPPPVRRVAVVVKAPHDEVGVLVEHDRDPRTSLCTIAWSPCVFTVFPGGDIFFFTLRPDARQFLRWGGDCEGVEQPMCRVQVPSTQVLPITDVIVTATWRDNA